MNQVSFNSLLYFQRYALDKLFVAKIKNSINTGYRVMVLAFCNSPHGPLSVYEVSDRQTKRQLYALPSGGIEAYKFDLTLYCHNTFWMALQLRQKTVSKIGAVFKYLFLCKLTMLSFITIIWLPMHTGFI